MFLSINDPQQFDPDVADGILPGYSKRQNVVLRKPLYSTQQEGFRYLKRATTKNVYAISKTWTIGIN